MSDRSGCYLTSACMAHYKEKFDDNCLELQVLRRFRDFYVSPKEVQHYYSVAPEIVKQIDKEQKAYEIYNKIYKGVVYPCVVDILSGKYEKAYRRYKMTILAYENKYRKKKWLIQDASKSVEETEK